MRTLLLLNVFEPEEIGARIKLARERAGLRQEDLADLISVSTRTVQNYEAGDTKPYSQMPLIARATGVTVEWLLHGDPEDTPDADAVWKQVEERLERLERQRAEDRAVLDEILRIARDDPEEPRARPDSK